MNKPCGVRVYEDTAMYLSRTVIFLQLQYFQSFCKMLGFFKIEIVDFQCCVFRCTEKLYMYICVCMYIYVLFQIFFPCQFSSVTQLCLTLCEPMNRSTPGLSVHHQFPEFTQTRIHQVSDAIQPSHPRSSPSPPAPNPSQHQSLFQRVNSSHEVAKVLEFQLQHHSFQRNPRADLPQNRQVGSPCSPRDSQESSPTPQFKRINSSVLSLLHSPTLTSIHDHRRNHSLDQTELSRQRNVSAFEYTIQVGHNFSSKE